MTGERGRVDIRQAFKLRPCTGLARVVFRRTGPLLLPLVLACQPTAPPENHPTRAGEERPTTAPASQEDIGHAEEWYPILSKDWHEHPPFEDDPNEMRSHYEDLGKLLERAGASRGTDDSSFVDLMKQAYEGMQIYMSAWMERHPDGLSGEQRIRVLHSTFTDFLKKNPDPHSENGRAALASLQSSLALVAKALDSHDLDSANSAIAQAKSQFQAMQQAEQEYQVWRTPTQMPRLQELTQEADARCRSNRVACETECESGGLYACNSLGGMYFDGDGVQKDRKKAMQYTQRACRLKNEVACTVIRRFDSQASTCDPAGECDQLCSWSGAACFSMGDRYFKGRGLPKDDGKAAFYFDRACDNGFGGGCRAAAVVNARSDQIVPDWQKIQAYYQRACDEHGYVDGADTCQEAENTSCMSQALVGRQRRPSDDAKCVESFSPEYSKAYQEPEDDRFNICSTVIEAAQCKPLRIREPFRGLYCCKR